MTDYVTTGIVTLSFPRLKELEDPMGNGTPKISTKVLVPKDDADTISKLKASVEQAKQEKWGDRAPANIRSPFKDGDRNGARDEEHGNIVFNTSSRRLVPIVDRDNIPLSPDQYDEKVYGGAHARLALRPYAYDVNGNRGIALGLTMVQVQPGGERIGGGGPSAESLFGPPTGASDEVKDLF